MNGALIGSLSANIILFIILLIIFILLIITLSSNRCPKQPIQPKPICPYIDTTPRGQLPFLPQKPYVLKTLSGLFVQSCFECLPTPVSCFNQGIIATKEWNGDSVSLIPIQNNNKMYNIKLNSKSNPTQTYYLHMVRLQNESYILCLTQNPNQPSAIFEIITYMSSIQGGSHIYQIGSAISGTLIGESNPTCLIKEGVPIEDGYNLSVNAPKGMDERSFFLMLPTS